MLLEEKTEPWPTQIRCICLNPSSGREECGHRRTVAGLRGLARFGLAALNAFQVCGHPRCGDLGDHRRSSETSMLSVLSCTVSISSCLVITQTLSLQRRHEAVVASAHRYVGEATTQSSASRGWPVCRLNRFGEIADTHERFRFYPLSPARWMLK